MSVEYILPYDWRKFYRVRYFADKEFFYKDEKYPLGEYQRIQKNGYTYLNLIYANGDKETYKCNARKCALEIQ